MKIRWTKEIDLELFDDIDEDPSCGEPTIHRFEKDEVVDVEVIGHPEEAFGVRTVEDETLSHFMFEDGTCTYNVNDEAWEEFQYEDEEEIVRRDQKNGLYPEVGDWSN